MKDKHRFDSVYNCYACGRPIINAKADLAGNWWKFHAGCLGDPGLDLVLNVLTMLNKGLYNARAVRKFKAFRS